MGTFNVVVYGSNMITMWQVVDFLGSTLCCCLDLTMKGPGPQDIGIVSIDKLSV